MRDRQAIRLRGHHLFCMVVANAEAGDIYNPRFAANARAYHRRIKANPNQVIKVVASAGDTCAFCPSLNVAENKCRLYDYGLEANQIDLDILQPLGFEIDMKITVSELRNRIRSVFTSLPAMCYLDCPFGEVLHCDEGFHRLQKESDAESQR
ncbi:MAG: DUF1284 domain-containing protein [Chloroflexi bacterium]|nr:DUF1284 domain-containing protein [Chloroflexota bacterium]